MTLKDKTIKGVKWTTFGSVFNAILQIVQLAILAGYKEIYLLGFDLGYSNDNTHFHTGYSQNKIKFDKNISFQKITPRYLKKYETWFVTEGKTVQKGNFKST